MPLRGNVFSKQKQTQETFAGESFLRWEWKDAAVQVPSNFIDLVEAIELSIKSIVLYTATMDTSNIMRDGASENINARLTSLENFVGKSYKDTVGEDYPNVSIAVKE
eukprot:1645441-Ditylum_brightwellii.AAC.1